MATSSEPRNPFYLLLLLVGFLFSVNAVAYAVVPVLEQKARELGEEVPPSPLRKALREDGWKWLLVEVAVLIVLGLAAMALDRYRHLQKERASPTIPSDRTDPPI